MGMRLGFFGQQMIRRELELSSASSARWRTLLNFGTVFGGTAAVCAGFTFLTAMVTVPLDHLFVTIGLSPLLFRIPIALGLAWYGYRLLGYGPRLLRGLRSGWIDAEALATVALLIPTICLLVWMVLAFRWGS